MSDEQKTQPEPVEDGNIQGSIRSIPVNKLVASDWNTNKMNPDEFNMLVEELKTNGNLQPPQVVAIEDGTYRIVGGEHRWRAACVLGWEKLDCLVMEGAKWTDEDLQKLQSVRLNVIKGQLNPDKFVKLCADLTKRYSQESLQGLMGFTDKQAFEKLLGTVKKEVKKSLPKEIAQKFDKASAEMKHIDDISAVLNRLFAKHGSTLASNYMVLSFGGKDHIYVAADSKVFARLKEICEHCAATKQDVNDYLGFSFKEVLKTIQKDGVPTVEPTPQAPPVEAVAETPIELPPSEVTTDA